MKFDRNSNGYTIIFMTILLVVVAVSLSWAFIFFKPFHEQNKRQEKMTDILYTIGLDKSALEQAAKSKGLSLNYDLIQSYFKQYIIKQLTLDNEGNPVQGINAFDIDLKKEMALPQAKQHYPLFIARYQGKTYYIIPMYGKGLWDDIWGYVALESDMNTIHGIKFGHKGETPGLGANITEKWFEDRFVGEKIFDANGQFTGILIIKHWKDQTNKDDHKIDAISGATLTSNGVENMINERLKHYVPYFKKQQNK